jgi:hypothetical protein
MCVCMHVYMYVCVYVSMYVCVYISRYVCMYGCMYVHTYMHTYAGFQLESNQTHLSTFEYLKYWKTAAFQVMRAVCKDLVQIWPDGVPYARFRVSRNGLSYDTVQICDFLGVRAHEKQSCDSHSLKQVLDLCQNTGHVQIDCADGHGT